MTIFGRTEFDARGLKLKCGQRIGRKFTERKFCGVSVICIIVPLGGCLEEMKANFARTSNFAREVETPKSYMSYPRIK